MTPSFGNDLSRLRRVGNRAALRTAWWSTACLLLVTCSVVPSAGHANNREPVHSYELGPSIQGLVYADGQVRIRLATEGFEQFILDIATSQPRARRPAPAGATYTAVFTQGAPGGLRGFAREADDDSDGLVDEDWADGLDNDGDGTIDEDFAAISDGMVVVSRTVASRRFHLETYHWNYSHLRAAMALNSRHTDSEGQSCEGSLILTLPAGRWYQTPFTYRRSGAGAGGESRQGVLFVAKINHPLDPGGSIWLGATTLRATDGSDATASHRARLVESHLERLEIPLVGGETKLALAVTSSPLVLRHVLKRFHAVHRGAYDLSGHKLVSWIVPSSSLAFRNASDPKVRWEPAGAEGMRLVFQVAPGDNGAFDPDGFYWGGQPLGSPARILWRISRDTGEEVHSHAWSLRSAADLARITEAQQDPYFYLPEILNHSAEGELIFEYAHPPPELTDQAQTVLSGATLCGRSYRATLDQALTMETDLPEDSVDEEESVSIATGTNLLTQWRRSGQAPTLSPDLLENYPNPFRVQTRIQYRIPETMEEGFVWEDEFQPDIEPGTFIPYPSGQPTVSLKVYSLSGKEIATLFEGTLGVGDYTADWDGTDAVGRTVASGTYFCKLQVDHWSVTKRVIFLR